MPKQTQEFEVEFYRGNRDDVEAIATLAERFFYESDFVKNLTLDPTGWRNTIRDNIDNPNACAIVAKDVNTDKIVGYILIYRQKDYTVEWVGELFQFYVSPEYRGVGVSRKLIECANQQYDEWRCKRVYVDCSPGMADPKHPQLFLNLWQKFGYHQMGITLKRDKE